MNFLTEKVIRNWTRENNILFVKLGNAVRCPKIITDNWFTIKERKSKKRKRN